MVTFSVEPVPTGSTKDRKPIAKALRTLAAAVIWVALGLPTVATASYQLPHLERGFSQVTAYDFGALDHVNLFNGNLVVTLPIGQAFEGDGALAYRFALVYNAKVWDWRVDDAFCLGDVEPRKVPVADAGRDFNAGMGWRLSLGALHAPSTLRNPVSSHWLYLGPDGSEHLLYRSLHEGEPHDGTHFYSRDGSYLRLTVDPAGWERLETPQGMTHVFDDTGFLRRIEDRFGNALTSTLTSSSQQRTWTLDDGFRQVIVTLSKTSVGDRPMDEDFVVTKISLPRAHSSTRAEYVLGYTHFVTDRPPGHDPQECSTRPRTVTVPYLSSITRPDGSSFALDYGFEPITSGTLTGLDLPTGGRFEWDYGPYTFPAGDRLDSDFPGSQPEFLSVAPGVVERRVVNEGGLVLGRWTYLSSFTAPSQPGGPIEEMITTVREYTRAQSTPNHTWLHFFSAYNDGTGNSVRRGLFGRPFSPLREQNGRYLSQAIRPSNSAARERTIWLRYEHDSRAHFDAFDRDADLNFRVAEELTDYHAISADRLVRRSDFDGLGSYRTETVSATDGSAPARTVHIARNPSSGTYPGSFHLPSDWLLTTFSHREATQGTSVDRIDACFDAAGFLTRHRLRGVASTRRASDVVRVFTRSPAGNLVREEHYGGDLQDVPTGTALCSLDLSGLTPSTAIDHTYAAGQRASSRHQGANFDTLNRTIDASTGLTRITREPDGLATTWSYDALGRVVGIEPVVDQGAKIDIAYSRDAHGLERAAINSRANDSVSPNAFLGHAEVWLNHLGLVRTRRVLMPDGVQWATERTFYDVNDRPSNVSTWYLSAHGGSVASGESIAETKTFGRDPWGRPDRLELPGGHDVKFTFRGERTVDRIDSVGIWTSSTVVEKDLYRKETRDVHGRLVQVDLGATDETNGPSLTAKYTYDVADRLTQVRLEGADRHGAQASQTRTFSYDGRGFLLAESHPEAAPVTYSRYDARGNVGRKDAGGITLHFSYDAAERLTRVDENLGGGTSRPLRVLTYGVNASGDRALGKVKTATRWTYGRLPWGDGTDPFAVPVTETLTYGGLGGRISSRATDFLSGAHIFTQGWTYTPLGAVASIDYPRCTSGCDGLDAPARTVEHGYSQGWLTRIEGYADSIAYHPSGLVTRIDHANGAVESIEADPWNRSMPRNIRLQATNAAVELGTHRYDGVGNLIHHELDLGAVPFSELTESLPRATSQVQVADYGYDRQQRLVHFRNTANQQQDYVYDAFGNLQQVTTTTPDSSGTPSVLVRDLATSSTTNRLEGPLFTYDPRGNLTAWGHKSFEYDALGMLTQVNFPASTSIFTADNERLCALKHDPSTWNDEVFTLRDLDGRVLTMLRKRSSQSGEVTWTWLRDYVYRGPKLLAQETSQPSPEDRVHLHLDHLGSPRGLTEANGRGLASFHYYGFGERILSAGADRPMALKSPLQYTGHERDFHAAWGDDLDNMHARHYSPWLGRFLSVDPRRVALLQFGDSNEEEQFERLLMQPRVWNQFSYGHDSPLVFTDPDGQAATMALAAPMAIGGEYAVVGSVGLTGPGALIFGSAAGGYLIGSGINELPGVSEFVSTGLGLALDHTVFMAANNRQRQRRVDGLIRNAEVHFGKIGGAGGPDRDPDLDHHKKEIRTALEDAKRVAQRLPGKARRLAEDRIDALIRKLDAL